MLGLKCKPGNEKQQAYSQKNKSKPCTYHHRVKQQSISEWTLAEPFVVAAPVSASQGHSHVSVKNSNHKWNSKKSGSGVYKKRLNACKPGNIDIRPGKK